MIGDKMVIYDRVRKKIVPNLFMYTVADVWARGVYTIIYDASTRTEVYMTQTIPLPTLSGKCVMDAFAKNMQEVESVVERFADWDYDPMRNIYANNSLT